MNFKQMSGSVFSKSVSYRLKNSDKQSQKMFLFFFLVFFFFSKGNTLPSNKEEMSDFSFVIHEIRKNVVQSSEDSFH